ncbi:MAG: hypothetical protein JXA67_18875 [Micromonosporaceae bacterium]|nr:hypothetical protein [Micromonosporaceae bacterium]
MTVIAGATLLTVVVLVATWLAADGVVRAVGGSAALDRWADLGNAFGVLSSVLSGMAFIVLIVTLWIQLRELALQRTELGLQRQAIERSSSELKRAAEAEMRSLHFELLRLSLEDPALARVWPDASAVDPERQRQLLYANLIYQHLVLAMGLDGATDDQIRATLRYVLRSEIMREYWTSAVALRHQTETPATRTWRIGCIGDEIMQEYACAQPGSSC